MDRLKWRAYAVLLLCAATATALPAQTFTTLHSFDSRDGANPEGGLVQAADGNLYGTTAFGGAGTVCPFGCGTIFKITPSGALTTLHSFDGADGQSPSATLVQAANGDLYGTAAGGGANGAGTVFRITPDGLFTTLHSFCSQSGCADGATPVAGLLQAADGNLYGTASGGGVNGCGTIFKITPSGVLTTLHSFDLADGTYPSAALVQADDGSLYGTTYEGGTNLGGTVFKITLRGVLTTLYSFCSRIACPDGELPEGGLIQAADENFYGTTAIGGTGGRGTVFKLTRDGALTTLYSFCSEEPRCLDGVSPETPLALAALGRLYGTTITGGAGVAGVGTVFKITPTGRLTTLYSFCTQRNCADGEYPGAVIEDTNGKLYGTALLGGRSRACQGGGCGTVFRLSVGLRPFVETQPTSAKVGAKVRILGTDLAGATSVTFNRTAARFAVVSPSLIITSVPTSATTGRVQVVTPSGTVSSNAPFRVRP